MNTNRLRHTAFLGHWPGIIGSLFASCTSALQANNGLRGGDGTQLVIAAPTVSLTIPPLPPSQ